jgi:hypothetical protein
MRTWVRNVAFATRAILGWEVGWEVGREARSSLTRGRKVALKAKGKRRL